MHDAKKTLLGILTDYFGLDDVDSAPAVAQYISNRLDAAGLVIVSRPGLIDLDQMKFLVITNCAGDELKHVRRISVHAVTAENARCGGPALCRRTPSKGNNTWGAAEHEAATCQRCLYYLKHSARGGNPIETHTGTETT